MKKKSDELNIPLFLVGKEFASIGYLESGFSNNIIINERTCHGNLPYCGEADGNCSECRHPSRRINKDTEFEFVDIDAGGY